MESNIFFQWKSVIESAIAPDDGKKRGASDVLINLVTTSKLMGENITLAGKLWHAVRCAHMKAGMTPSDFLSGLRSNTHFNDKITNSLNATDPYSGMDVQAWLKYLGYTGSYKHNYGRSKVMDYFHYPYDPKTYELEDSYIKAFATATQFRNTLPGHQAGNTFSSLSFFSLMRYYESLMDCFTPLATTVWEDQQFWQALLADVKKNFFRLLGEVSYRLSDILVLAGIPANDLLVSDLLKDTAAQLTDSSMTFGGKYVKFCGDVLDFAQDLKAAWDIANQHLPGGVKYMVRCIYQRCQMLGILDLSPEGLRRMSLEMLCNLAEDQNPNAMLELGRRYWAGSDGADRDGDAAVCWFTKASKDPETAAEGYYQLGLCAGTGYDRVAPSRSKARSFMDDAAKLGHPAAQVWVGLDCEESDPQAAFGWFQKADAQHDPEGQYHLGRCYENGIGIQPDEELAISRYRAALTGGCREAKHALAMILPRDYQGYYCQETLDLLQELVQEGDPVAMCDLADHHAAQAEQLRIEARFHLGSPTITGDAAQEHRRAEELYLKAAECGYSPAWIKLGHLYVPYHPEFQDYGIRPEEWAHSMEYYRKAADAQNADGYYQLGWAKCCIHGFRKIPSEEAMDHFRDAAALGHGEALLIQGICGLEHGVWHYGEEPFYYRLDDAAQKGSTRAKLLTKVFEDHYPSEATCDWSGLIQELQKVADGRAIESYALAYCYFRRAKYGTTPEQDTKLGLYWLDAAAKEGSKAAMYDLYERLDDPEAAMVWLKRAANDGSFRAMRQMYRVTCADDPQTAAAWLHKAADAGDFGSKVALDCLERGEPVRFDIEQP